MDRLRWHDSTLERADGVARSRENRMRWLNRVNLVEDHA